MSSSTRPCPHCEGTGLVRTASSAGLSALRLIGNRLRDQRTEWERPPHKPVAQQNMGAGTVELF